ncbi:MAG: AAA family ATPase, partial [Promethearchaeota archaeon]
MKVIGFCGLPGSGKSTAINAVRDLGIVVNMGDIIRSEAKNRKIEPSDENLGKIATELREKHGKSFIAQKC